MCVCVYKYLESQMPKNFFKKTNNKTNASFFFLNFFFKLFIVSTEFDDFAQTEHIPLTSTWIKKQNITCISETFLWLSGGVFASCWGKRGRNSHQYLTFLYCF